MAVITAESIARGLILKEANRMVGVKQGSSTHRRIIDDFNKIKPDGSGMGYSDPWCAAFATVMAVRAFGRVNAEDYFPLSYNCNTIIAKAQKMGIWKESDKYKPKNGDWILYDWDDSGYGDNKGSSDHVGIVKGVYSNAICVIEGNKGTTGQVGERIVPINGRYIRGFVCPKYDRVTIQGRAILEAEKLAKQAVKDKMKYNGSATYNTYKKAKEGKKQINCATFISYVLQGIKVLPWNRRIWLSDVVNGSGSATLKKRAKVTYPKKTPKKLLDKLQPGDIVGWKLPHTAMVHHIDGKKIYWITAGKTDVALKKLIRRRPFYYRRKADVLIHLKQPEK